MMPNAPCFIGNSHVACIRQAVEQTESPFKKVTFLYGRINSLQDTEMTGRRLVNASARIDHPKNLDPGPAEIVINDHDLFAFFGLRIAMVQLFGNLHKRLRLQGHPVEPGQSVVPRSDIQTALAEVAANTLAFRLARLVRQCSDAPIFVVAQPCPSENFLILDPPAHTKIKFGPLLDERIGPDLYEVFVETMQTLTRKEKLVFVEQPRETLARGCFTKNEYQKNDQDVLHMNSHYGLRVLRALASAASMAGNGSPTAYATI